MKQAARAGKSGRFADLEKEYFALCPAIARPVPKSEYSPVPESHRYISISSRSFGTVSGVLKEDEWDKTIPRRLRSTKGRFAWQTLACWGSASESEKENLRERLSKLSRSSNAAYALYRILMRLDADNGRANSSADAVVRGDPEFFSEFAIALEEKERRAFEKLKQDLIIYRFSLNWSRTPEQPRHTKSEIKRIVAPNSSITQEVFDNMIRKFRVPHLRGKSGKASPNYGNRSRR